MLPNPKSNLKPQSSLKPKDKNNGSEGMVIMATDYYRKDEGKFKVQENHLKDTIHILESHYHVVEYDEATCTVTFKDKK